MHSILSRFSNVKNVSIKPEEKLKFNKERELYEVFKKSGTMVFENKDKGSGSL